MFLHVVGHNQRFRVIGMNFRRSIETISRYFQEVLYAVGELRNEMIVPPATSVHPKILNSSRWYPYFKDCIGAIDGTHVLARVPAKMQPAFLGRKHTPTQNGVKTDKGFKEVHVNAVARQLSEFINQDVTGTQVYNHLRKWRQRWVKVCKLRDISGALWDEDNYMIVLDEEHLLGHTKDHPKDAEFLNTPIENYLPMQTIFGSGQATGRFAMGSNEPLGIPTDMGQLEPDNKTETINLEDVTNLTPDSGPKYADEKCKFGSGSGSGSGSGPSSGSGFGCGKRKRSCAEEAFMAGITKAVQNVADAMSPMPPGLYDAVMLTGGFTEEQLMYALQNLLDNKALGKCFVEMTESHRVLWLRNFLAKHAN
ncbi:hypothetical protein BS78_05G176900 [Paspalum vaginatum]|nr:hypothetical protein BS78_05G176900 [Paspalum vaginatum]